MPSNKKVSRSKLVKKLDTVFSQYIRLKNSVDENAVTDLFRHYYSEDTGHLSIAEHKEVTAAIIAKDPERASSALHAHIAGSREFLIKTMDVLGRP